MLVVVRVQFVLDWENGAAARPAAALIRRSHAQGRRSLGAVDASLRCVCACVCRAVCALPIAVKDPWAQTAKPPASLPLACRTTKREGTWNAPLKLETRRILIAGAGDLFTLALRLHFAAAAVAVAAAACALS
jgi:hypothetical protein